MNKSKVALVGCNTYDEERVYEAVIRGLGLLGGAGSFVKQGERIVMKPNVLFGLDPAACVTTHPAVFKAAARALKEAGAELYYGDSPGFGKCEPNMQKAGLKRAADELGVKPADFDAGRAVVHQTALLNKRFVLANGVLDAAGLVSLPKLKTHGLTRMTGAIKNQFGCVPGILKTQFHIQMPDPYDFAAMLVDINTFIRPRLYIMDGITAMEGNGPRNGKPRSLNFILLSNDPVALDATAARIIDLNPAFVPTSDQGERSGLGTYQQSGIDILGENLEAFIARDFDVIRKPPVRATAGRLRKFFKNQICPRPVIDRELCTQCGTCVEVCPVEPKALNWDAKSDKVPRHDYDQCIRCFCCQEMCPEGAITIKNTLLGRVVSG
ncbi:MAG: DUF362 domain-containing protein [Dehalococcoidia bacterium]